MCESAYRQVASTGRHSRHAEWRAWAADHAQACRSAGYWLADRRLLGLASLRVDIGSPSPKAAPSPPQARLTATQCVVSGDVLTIEFINDESQTIYLNSFDVNLYDSQGNVVGARTITASEVSDATALAIAPNSIRHVTYRGVLSLSAAACIMTEWLGGFTP
jgi:hypothetical protein